MTFNLPENIKKIIIESNPEYSYLQDKTEFNLEEVNSIAKIVREITQLKKAELEELELTTEQTFNQ